MELKYLVVHCSATRCNVPFSVEQLRRCHVGQGWEDIGYHLYITREGRVHQTRSFDVPGIHARGFNHCSLGICYEGGLDAEGRPADTRTRFQKASLLDVLTILKYQYPGATVLGHCQLPGVRKACPCFDAEREYRELIF